MLDPRPALVLAALTLGPAAAWAQPVTPSPAAPTGPTSTATAQPVEPPPPVAEPPPRSSPTTDHNEPRSGGAQPTTSPEVATGPAAPRSGGGSPAVDDAAWEALQGRRIAVETSSGSAQGELLRSDGDTLVLVHEDGRVLTVPKVDALGVRVLESSPTAAPTETQPSAAESMAGLSPTEPAGKSQGREAASPPPEEGEEELTPGQKRRKERREKREHALLGAFTMQGATYTHWRGDGVQAGHASYAMDWGLGINPSPGFGMYAMAGGLLGAKIRNKDTDERIKANYGHVVFIFAFSRKYFFSTVGAGVAFSRLRFSDPALHENLLQKDRGLAIPTRLVGKIPLPHKLYLGLGITYELGLVRGFSRAVNGIGGQIVVGRW